MHPTKNSSTPPVKKMKIRPCCIDGNPTKTVKANLMHMLEGMSLECVNNFLPRNSAIMMDAMALLQSLTRIPKTFGELAAHVLSRLLSLAGFHKASRIDFVADLYPDHSIKANERNRRAAQGSTLVNIYGKIQPMPMQWKKYLNSGKNKEAIITFLIDCWKDLKSEDLTGLILYATRGNKYSKISPTSQSTIVETTEVVELECDHEEADIRLLLHAKHASDNGRDGTQFQCRSIILHHRKSEPIKDHFSERSVRQSRQRDMQLDYWVPCVHRL
jgi:hypothetical protein